MSCDAFSLPQMSCDAFSLESDTILARATERLNSDKAASPEVVRLINSKLSDDLAPGLSRCVGRPVISLDAKHAHVLHDQVTGRNTINVAMSSGGNLSKLKFAPGDHLAVFPKNRPEIVEAIMERLQRCPEGAVELQVMRKVNTPLGIDKRWEAHQKLPKTSVATMLTRYLDITTPPTPNMLRTLAVLAKDENERARLKHLATDPTDYENWKHANWPTLAETLADFPSIEADAPFILCNLPMMQARAYSISSSPVHRPEEVQLTVAVVQYRTHSGATHYGVCSNYLNDIETGEKVYCYFRSAPSFHLPENKADSIVMVGPGTGVAPFRSFWEHRLHDIKHANPGAKIGAMTLFFGCRNRQMDLYTEEKAAMMTEGVISKCHLALSRQPGVPKTYVQDQLTEQSDDILETLTSGHGHVYVCGDCTMAEDVYLNLQKILVNRSGMTAEEARQHMETMRETSHYHEDIFGITLRTAETTTKTRALIERKASIDKDSGLLQMPKYRRDSISISEY